MTTEPTPNHDLEEALRGFTDPGERFYFWWCQALDPTSVGVATGLVWARGGWARMGEETRALWRDFAAALDHESRARAFAECIAEAERVGNDRADWPGEASGARSVADALRALAAKGGV